MLRINPSPTAVTIARVWHRLAGVHHAHSSIPEVGQLLTPQVGVYKSHRGTRTKLGVEGRHKAPLKTCLQHPAILRSCLQSSHCPSLASSLTQNGAFASCFTVPSPVNYWLFNAPSKPPIPPPPPHAGVCHRPNFIHLLFYPLPVPVSSSLET